MNAAAEKTRGVTWRAVRPKESEAAYNNVILRIKQSVGKDADSTFWYCYHDNRYCGVERTLELAKSRAMSGRMRMPSSELEEWLSRYGDDLPEDLLQAERARLAAWKKNPQPAPRLTEPHPNPRPKPGRDESAGGGTNVERVKTRTTAKGERPAGRLNQDAKVHVLKKEFTGKDGTKWRERQKKVFAMDGAHVKEIKDDDALKNMIRDGQIELREK